MLLLYGNVVLIGSFLVGNPPYGPFPWSLAVYFLFGKAGKFKSSMARVPYNKLLILTWLVRAVLENIGPRLFFARTSLRIPQYGPRVRLVRGYYLFRNF